MEVYRETNDLRAYAHSIRRIADIYRQEQKLTEARLLYEEALELYRGHFETRLLDLANAVRPYALVIEQEGDLAFATKLWKEARHLYASLRMHAGVSGCDVHLVQLQERS